MVSASVMVLAHILMLPHVMMLPRVMVLARVAEVGSLSWTARNPTKTFVERAFFRVKNDVFVNFRGKNVAFLWQKQLREVIKKQSFYGQAEGGGSAPSALRP